MPLIIDGYNLLHATGIFGRPTPGTGSLQRSRDGLIEFVLSVVEATELKNATIVFDASEAPPGLPRVIERGGLTVRYASAYREADDLIEELILAETSPRQLVVVSSDHRIQRAAKRRKATAIDSNDWYGQVVHRMRSSQVNPIARDIKPNVPLGQFEITRWLKEFGDVNEGEPIVLPPGLNSPQKNPAKESPSQPAPPKSEEDVPPGKKKTKRRASYFPEEFGKGVFEELDRGIVNPFPPGYGEDLLED